MVAVSLKKKKKNVFFFFLFFFLFFFFKQKTAYEISLGLVGSEMCIRDRTQSAAPAPTPRWQVWVRKYAVAAAVLLIGGVGVSVFQWGRNSRQAELSLRNGQPIPQEQVNEYALAAFTKLGDCVQLCSEQNDEIGELFGRLQDSYQNSMEKIPFVSGDGWTLTDN